MNRVIYCIIIVLGSLFLFTANMKAQCGIENKQFQSGEVLNYDLYFKYGIIYKKAGVASLTVTDRMFAEKEAYNLRLTARSTGLIKSFFTVNDTLTSVTTKDLVPLRYNKDAHEDDDHTVERATYTYSDGSVTLRNINKRNGRLRYDTTFVTNNCMYDVISIIYYARTLDFSQMKKGDRKTVSFFAGRRMMNMKIEHQGIESVKANDGREYKCVKLALIGKAAAFEDENEAMKVYLTNDRNRIPVRIESKLKIGTARVVMKNYRGQRN
ncbi:DUF3108 domain-containing protein [Bacteroides sp. 519]|uniref:DUF3108 domain-containing protein n=1 Tax=Bacteroides sp. 519 TaxID=2302937 RepID=UPI0013D72E04|nr:DUF3108 domain-containing protein [Bacteroides sp. 519]NDV58859.1 DUF3108 domain-containing protein [Bacteroides sp. 519]